ncbi:MAG: hypothetical protein A2Y17_07000 [Clostridiales bacterium GWF2_38_85]|nr:MAG: hypothetical protein A2Y17_07000 [Clostridiales bacterium GWF2_38_85]HBL84965.1 hypothetical protein [Clostridiales bacterium]
MDITNIKIRKLFTEGDLKAIISITFDDSLVVHDIKLITSDDRIIIAMPNRKTPSGFIDIVHPINSEFREKIDRTVKEYYNSQIEFGKLPID